MHRLDSLGLDCLDRMAVGSLVAHHRERLLDRLAEAFSLAAVLLLDHRQAQANRGKPCNYLNTWDRLAI
jgi:hypothetical protein